MPGYPILKWDKLPVIFNQNELLDAERGLRITEFKI